MVETPHMKPSSPLTRTYKILLSGVLTMAHVHSARLAWEPLWMGAALDGTQARLSIASKAGLQEQLKTRVVRFPLKAQTKIRPAPLVSGIS